MATSTIELASYNVPPGLCVIINNITPVEEAVKKDRPNDGKKPKQEAGKKDEQEPTEKVVKKDEPEASTKDEQEAGIKDGQAANKSEDTKVNKKDETEKDELEPTEKTLDTDEPDASKKDEQAATQLKDGKKNKQDMMKKDEQEPNKKTLHTAEPEASTKDDQEDGKKAKQAASKPKYSKRNEEETIKKAELQSTEKTIDTEDEQEAENMKAEQQVAKLDDHKKDEQDLAALFLHLGFDVKIHGNLTAREIVRKTEFYSKFEHRGAFVMVILSHGSLVDNRAAVLGVDNEPVTITRLQELLKNCSSLHGVPKLLLVDASSCTTSSRAARAVAEEGLRDFLIMYASTDKSGAPKHPGSSDHRPSQIFVKSTQSASNETPIRRIIQSVKTRMQESTPHLTFATVDTLTKDYFIKREENMPSFQQLLNKFCKEVEALILIRAITIQEIEKTIENLQGQHRNVNVARILGSVASLVGSGMTIAGFVMAPATFGASAATLSVSGAALAVVGGTTAAGASIAETMIEKSNVRHAQEQFSRDCDQISLVSAIAKAVERQLVTDVRERQCNPTANFVIIVAELLTQGIFRSTNLGVKVAEILVTAFNALRAGGPQAVNAAGVWMGEALVGAAEAFGSLIGAALLSSPGQIVGAGAGRGFAAAALDLWSYFSTSASAISRAAVILRGASVTTNVVLVPVDLVQIVRGGRNIWNGSNTNATKQLTDIVQQLKKEEENLTLLQEQLRNNVQH